MAICATETRVLRWTFRRDQDAVVCELGLNSDDSAYELRLNPPWNLREITTEVFEDAMQAFQRHYRTSRVDGIADATSVNVLEKLVAKKKPS